MPSADQASHDSALALLTMRGARRSHNTIARTADRRPRSMPPAIRSAAREPWDPAAKPGLVAPTPTDSAHRKVALSRPSGARARRSPVSFSMPRRFMSRRTSPRWQRPSTRASPLPRRAPRAPTQIPSSTTSPSCTITARVLSRQTHWDHFTVGRLLQACTRICRLCAEECARHAHHRHCAICEQACRACVEACSALLTAEALEQLDGAGRGVTP